MAVFRVERTKDYTVMCNHHLKDMNLSLKAKGLLSMMLSLPETWNYTTRGLAAICKEGVDAIGRAVRELEAAGYIVRRQLRSENGRITDTEYVIYERPQYPDTPDPEPGVPQPDGPDTSFPHTAFPYVEESDVVTPYVKNPAQLNIYQENTNQSNKNLYPTDGRNARAGASGEEGCAGSGVCGCDRVRQERERIRGQIEYSTIVTVENREQVDEFVEIMLEVALCGSPTIRIGRRREYPTALVQGRFARIDSSHIERLLDAIQDNTVPVRNTKAYLLAALFDAPATKDNHYTMEVNSK